MTRGGLPHSEIPGSKLICSSPGLIAACHVLHRLLAPRHSPYTLSSLTIRNSKLTLPDRLHTIERATVPCNTACVVVGKNYRLQNIQLSKIRWGPSPQAPGSLACGDPKAPRRSLAGSVTPARSLARGPFTLLRSLAGSLRNALHRESDYVGPAIGAPRLPICCPPAGRRRGTAARSIGTDVGAGGNSRVSLSLAETFPAFAAFGSFGVAGMSLRCHFKELACLAVAAFIFRRGEGWWRIPGSNR